MHWQGRGHYIIGGMREPACSLNHYEVLGECAWGRGKPVSLWLCPLSGVCWVRCRRCACDDAVTVTVPDNEVLTVSVGLEQTKKKEHNPGAEPVEGGSSQVDE